MEPVKDVQRVYGGQTAAERAAERRAALVDAAFAEVAAKGWRALRIETVCRAAGLNKRYFYEAFADLDALVGAVTAKVADDAIAVTLAALPDTTDQRRLVRAGVAAFVVHLTDDPRRARVLFGAVAADDAASGHRAEAIRRVIATAAMEGRELHRLGDDPIVELTAAMLVGGSSQALLDWLDGRLDYSREELIEHLAALWLSLGDAAAARHRGAQDGPAREARARTSGLSGGRGPSRRRS